MRGRGKIRASHGNKVTRTSRGSDPTLQELLAFERLLSDLSARLANVTVDRVVGEIEDTLKQLIKFLGFDRGTFIEITDGEKQSYLCSAAVKGVEPKRGPVPDDHSWFIRELRAGRTIVIRSYEEIPPEAAASVEYFRRVGIRSQLVIPLSVGGHVVSALGFGARQSTRHWPDYFIARVKVIGEVMAQALAQKRSEAALRASEDRWRSLFDNPIFGITFVDEHHRFVTTNQTFQTMVGYSNDELRGLTPLDISVPEEGQINAAFFREIQQGTRDHFQMIKRLRRKDGKLIWINLYVFAFNDRRSGAKFAFGMNSDITERQRAQDALRETRAELARVARMNQMGALSGSIAHEINQPLAAIATNANAGLRWLDQAAPNVDETRMVLQRIVHDANRSAEVIKSLRAIFKADDQARVSVNLNTITREALILTQSELERHNIVVQTELAHELPPLVLDRVQLQQVLLNLITNAIDAMDSLVDRNRILRVKSELNGNEAVFVTVEDSGTGIAPENIDRIFNTFFTTKPTGMGMGLAICRSIVESHGGTLSVSPGRPHGAVFKIVLPIATPDAE